MKKKIIIIVIIIIIVSLISIGIIFNKNNNNIISLEDYIEKEILCDKNIYIGDYKLEYNNKTMCK